MRWLRFILLLLPRSSGLDPAAPRNYDKEQCKFALRKENNRASLLNSAREEAGLPPLSTLNASARTLAGQREFLHEWFETSHGAHVVGEPLGRCLVYVRIWKAGNDAIRGALNGAIASHYGNASFRDFEISTSRDGSLHAEDVARVRGRPLFRVELMQGGSASVKRELRRHGLCLRGVTSFTFVRAPLGHFLSGFTETYWRSTRADGWRRRRRRRRRALIVAPPPPPATVHRPRWRGLQRAKKSGFPITPKARHTPTAKHPTPKHPTPNPDTRARAPDGNASETVAKKTATVGKKIVRAQPRPSDAATAAAMDDAAVEERTLAALTSEPARRMTHYKGWSVTASFDKTTASSEIAVLCVRFVVAPAAATEGRG